MDKKSLERSYRRIEENVFSRNLKDALDFLKDLVINSRKGDLISQYENLDDTYENLLKYTIEGIKDPERDKIYRRLQVSVLELSDLALHHAYMNESNQYVYRLKKKIEYETRQVKEDAIDSIENLVFDEELADVLHSSIESGINEKEEYSKHNELLLKIFNLLWLTDKFKDSDLELIEKIWKAENFNWYEKAIVISAITLSALRCFDEKKINLMMDFISDKHEVIRYRSLVGLFLILYTYDRRLTLYPDIIKRLEVMSDDDLEKQIEMITIQFLKSKETEKITKRLQEEILPEVVKYQPVIRDKLDLDNILSDDLFEDKNPDWERVFEDAPDLLDKLQEISKLQMEGADVFMSTFARLKHFAFFNDIINWFRPFYKENYDLTHALVNEGDNFKSSAFMEGLEESFFMCNSDKYSFCLNIPHMPEIQKSMMLEMFNAELESLREIQKDDELLNASAMAKSNYSQYIHDLYRFYKIHPLRNEFSDVFTLKFDIYNCHTLRILVRDDEIIRNIGEYLFERDHFDQALEVYLLLNKGGDNSLEIFEKIGYCYQQLRKLEEAINFYKKAELYDSNRAWNLKKIAQCYRQKKDYRESLSYFLEAEKLEKDNIYVLTYIGHSYLDLKEFENALNYYYRVEFMAIENKKVLRPIAWCSFVLGKLDNAKKYYERLIEDQANKYDFMNMGHVEWCLGNYQSAIKNYKLSVNRGDNNFRSFQQGFEEDKHYLIQNGIDLKEIPLMLDYIKYQL
jgi:tetratricopeptide (TPR) repeat protein